MLKSTAAAIAPSITKFFNQSIRHTVVFQGAGKRQSLYLYPRSKEPRANDVRPISLLPILSKVLKQHIHFLLTEHICNHSQLSKFQFGFQHGKSTVSALLSVTHNWLMHLKRQEVGAVFFDYLKAFDCVQHQPLIDKLHNIGLHPHAYHQLD